MRMNKREEFKKVVNCYLIIKYFDESSEEYKSAFKILKTGSPYTCMSCSNNSGLSFLEPKHDCRNPMYNRKHIPYEKYMIEKCAEYGWDWQKIDNHFQGKIAVSTGKSSEVNNGK